MKSDREIERMSVTEAAQRCEQSQRRSEERRHTDASSLSRLTGIEWAGVLLFVIALVAVLAALRVMLG